MNGEKKHTISLWRYGIIGPLISMHLEHGELAAMLRELSDKSYETPDGRRVKLSASTLESWLYRYRKFGLKGLEPEGRKDRGKSRTISEETAALIIAMKQENMARSVRSIIRALERAKQVRRLELKKSNVHRLLQAHGISKRIVSPEIREMRAFRHPFAGDCTMSDVMHGPLVLDEKGKLRKSYLHLFLDSATRFVTACEFRLSEKAQDHEAVLKQAVLKFGLFGKLYTDNGSAQVSGSLKAICAEMGIHLIHARPYHPQGKGAVERIFRTIRASVLSELPEGPIPLSDLNDTLWAWLSMDYHKRIHGGTGKIPLDDFLSQTDRLRSFPRNKDIDEVFRHRDTRRVRQDGTVRWRGKLLEVPFDLAGKMIQLRFDPTDPEFLPKVFIDDNFHCDTRIVDPIENSRKDRTVQRNIPEVTVKSGIDPIKEIKQEYHHLREG